MGSARCTVVCPISPSSVVARMKGETGRHHTHSSTCVCVSSPRQSLPLIHCLRTGRFPSAPALSTTATTTTITPPATPPLIVTTTSTSKQHVCRRPAVPCALSTVPNDQRGDGGVGAGVLAELMGLYSPVRTRRRTRMHSRICTDMRGGADIGDSHARVVHAAHNDVGAACTTTHTETHTVRLEFGRPMGAKDDGGGSCNSGPMGRGSPLPPLPLDPSTLEYAVLGYFWSYVPKNLPIEPSYLSTKMDELRRQAMTYYTQLREAHMGGDAEGNVTESRVHAKLDTMSEKWLARNRILCAQREELRRQRLSARALKAEVEAARKERVGESLAAAARDDELTSLRRQLQDTEKRLEVCREALAAALVDVVARRFGVEVTVAPTKQQSHTEHNGAMRTYSERRTPRQETGSTPNGSGECLGVVHGSMAMASESQPVVLVSGRAATHVYEVQDEVDPQPHIHDNSRSGADGLQGLIPVARQSNGSCSAGSRRSLTVRDEQIVVCGGGSQA